MRTIRFRGKWVGNRVAGTTADKWEYGCLAFGDGYYYILSPSSPAVGWFQMKRVSPETIGQYTGFTDEDGEDIYEGDWVEWSEYEYSRFPGRAPKRVTVRGHIIFNEGAWIIASKSGARYLDRHVLEAGYGCEGYGRENKVRIIGNIHDNPELLEVSP